MGKVLFTACQSEGVQGKGEEDIPAEVDSRRKKKSENGTW